jgi:ribokinase
MRENRTKYSIVDRRASIKEAIMTAKIVVVGSFNADLVSYMERIPRPGETVHGDRFATGAGGKGSNQAVAAARLGADVSFIGRLGKFVKQKTAYEIWDAEGVNHDFVKRDSEVATGVAPILVDSSGENMIVVVLGANERLRKSDIDAARERIAAADMLVVQLEVNLEMVPYALKAAKEFGVATILNPAPAAPISRETIQLADYLTPNETELEALTGGADDVVSAARSLITRDDQTAVVTLGAKGAQIVTLDDTALAPTFAVDVVDTTGAGDTFNAALAVGLSEGMALGDAVRFANAAAALCVTKPGAADSVPYRADVDALLLGQT